MTKLETMYVVPNMLSPRDLVFRPDIEHILYHDHKNHTIVVKGEY